MKTLQTMKTILLMALIAMTLACGYGSKNYAPVAGTMPAITQLAPANANAGSASFLLTVNGSGFGSKAVVNFNGAAEATTYVSSYQLTAMIPAAAIATAGNISVSVTNPATSGTGMYGSGGTLAETSGPMSFTIN
jgi:hypothetical protein